MRRRAIINFSKTTLLHEVSFTATGNGFYIVLRLIEIGKKYSGFS
jgi:hypothetical protein